MKSPVAAALALLLITPGLVYSQATTFEVTSANDADDGQCDAIHCSLREAINAANANAGVDTITFSIGGPGVKSIQPNSALPSISEGVFINGISEPNFAGAPVIELNGTGAGAAADGLHLTGDGSTIIGLIITRFANGIHIEDSANNIIGSDTDSESSIIAVNSGAGILISGAGSTDNVVRWNTIEDNGGAGVALLGSGVGNTIISNFIFDNAGLGIDLENDGVTPNDPDDSDTGSNGLQNFPDLSKVVFAINRVEGQVHSTATTQFRLEFFSVTDCDPTGHGQGAIYFGHTDVTTDANGDADFNFTLAGNIPLGEYVTTTATNADGSTSEFSGCMPATTYSVRIAPDSGKTQRGGTEDYSVFITPAGGPWDQEVTLSCGNLPGLTTCEFTPESFVLDTAEVRSNFTVTTTDLMDSAVSASSAGNATPVLVFWFALLAAGVPGIAFLLKGVRSEYPRRRRLLIGASVTTVVLSLALYTGCGDDDSTGVVDAGTPRGRHVFTVNATSQSLTATDDAVLVVE